MQQRQLRLGDILDDYCTHERRVTNHAIVAMVGSDIRQTRCTTCDTEHPYKRARVPPQRKKKDAKASLYEQVLSTVTEGEGAAADASIAASRQTDPDPVELPGDGAAVAPEESTGIPAGAMDAAPESPAAEAEVRVHRALIRATLPRVEGQTPARPVPEFTVRQAATRPGGRFRSHHAAGGRPVDRPRGRGPSDHGAGSRDPGSRPGFRHAARPGHSPHQTGTRPTGQHHPHPSHRGQPGPPARGGRKHSK